MILDNQVLLSDKQSLALVEETPTPSTNVIDLGAMGVVPYNKNQLVRNIGKADKVPFLAQINEALAGTDVTGLTIAFQVCDAEAFNTGVTTVLSITVPKAALVQGYILPVTYLPRSLIARYFRLVYTVEGTGAASAGAITAGVVAAVDGAYRG